jgi:Fe-S cluster biogenesis protein NfuA
MEERVKTAIEEIRPALQRDGGDIEFVELEGNTVKVRLRGACHGCPSAQYTLAFGVERHIKKRVPEVESVIAVS